MIGPPGIGKNTPHPRRASALPVALFLGLGALWLVAPVAGQVLSDDSVSVQIVPAPPPPPPPPRDIEAPQSAAENSRAAIPPPSGPYTISGSVVSASSGAPLDRAEVTLSTAGQNRTQLAEVITSATGTFRFDHLGAGKYTIEASRRGYITAGYQEHDGFVTAIVTGPDLDTHNIRLDLFPNAIIGGVITDDAGDTVAGAQVTLYRQTHDSGESHTVNARTDTTDDTGTYEFSRLRPGTYYIAVSASPWYAFHPAAKTDANDNPLPPDQQPHSPLDVAYATTFFPNATDSASAAPLTVNPGDRVEANLSLHAVPAVHIQIRIPQPNGSGRGINIPQLSTDVFGTEQTQSIPTVLMRHSSGDSRAGNMTADIGGIAPGHYSLREFTSQGEIRGPGIDLTTSQTLDFTPDTTTADVSGKLAMASGQKLPSGVTASLIPAQGRLRNNAVRVSSDGSFDFPSVAPGAYEFQVRSSGRALAIAQMAASGAEVEGSHITVVGDSVLLAATVVSGSATISGYAKVNDRGLGGVMVLLVPRDPNASRELWRRFQTESDGSFTLNRVAPGDYTLVAIDNGWTLDWALPDVIAPYLAHGLRLNIADQQKLELSSPLAVQSR